MAFVDLWCYNILTIIRWAVISAYIIRSYDFHMNAHINIVKQKGLT